MVSHACLQSYYTTITVGTPPVKYAVVLDTGSADLVLATQESNACFGSSSQGCDITASLYSPALSNSSVTTSQTVQVTYGTGSASGVIVKDTMSIAGFTATQNIAACDQVTDLVTSSDQSGLWGLAFRTLSASNSMPFLQGLYQAGQLSSPEFGFGFTDLSIDDTSAQAVVPGGTMTIGGTDSSLYTGDINWISLSSAQYWSIPLTDVTVGGTSVGVTDPAAVIDTGTNGIAVPSDIAATIYAAIPGSRLYSASSGVYLYPCSSSVNVAFTFGGVSYAIPPSDFDYGQASSSQCIGAISSLGVSSSSSSALTIIGTPFLFSRYNAYRFSPAAVGFAPLASSAASTFKGQAIPTSNGTNFDPTATGTVVGKTSGAGGVGGKGTMGAVMAVAMTAVGLAVGLAL